MISLLFAILSSTLVSVMMRFGESRASSQMGLLVSNYSICTLLGGFFMLRAGLPGSGDGWGFALGLGIVGGFFFLASLMVFQRSIARNGLVLSSTFMKLGVLVPTLAAIQFFHETPGVMQLAGLELAVGAIIVMNAQGGQRANVSGKLLLLLVLLVNGGTDVLTNVYDKMGNPLSKDVFLVVVFLTALVLSVMLLLRQGGGLGKWDILCGLAVGIPNYLSSRFLLAALKTVPAVVVFPVYSTSTILLITTSGILLFHEKLERRKQIAMVMILAALVLLNL